MIERLLAAEAALTRGELDLARRLFGQVAEADPRNAIAVVGLARVARREGRDDEARSLAERALVIDPDEAAASRLLRELLAAAPADVDATPSVVVTPSVELPPVASSVAERPPLLARIRRWLLSLRGRA
jgi:hypothetical protein